MFKFRSLFSKMLFVNIAVVLAVIICLTGMLTIGMRSLVIDSTVNNLKKVGEEYNDFYNSVYSDGDSVSSLKFASRIVADFEDIQITVYDKYGNEYLSVTREGSDFSGVEDLISENVKALQSREDDGFGWTSRNDSSVFSTPTLSVRYPLTVDSSVKGYVYMHIRLSFYRSIMETILKRLLLCFAVSVVIAVLMTYISYRNIIKTVKEINSAAGAFARGNFKDRVKVSGNDEIATLAVTYNNMADELEKYESTRQSFVANVSHELRSPLTSVQGFAQGMLDGTIEQEEMPQYLEIVLNETKRMSLLIQDLLDLAKIESGQFPLDMSKYDICEEIRRTIINFIGKIEDKEILLTADIPEEQKFVKADKRRIAQVLTNLLDNAVKFCEQGGTLKIWTYDADGRIHINISNSGAYIPEEDLPYVFDRFFKVDKSHTKRSPGTGIGLSIVKNIVNQHGEKIWVNSRKGTGTVFTFTLRLAEDEAKSTGSRK